MPNIPSTGFYDAAVGRPGTSVVASNVTHTQSSSTLTDVTGLLVPIGSSATEIWFCEAYLMVVGTTAADIKLGWTFPTAATMAWGTIGNTSSQPGWTPFGTATSPTALAVQTDTQSYGALGSAYGVMLAGYIFGGGTSGNVQLQFAQVTPGATDLIVNKGSMLRYQRLAT